MVCKVDGVISEIKTEGKDKIIIVLPEDGEKSKTKANIEYPVNYHRVVLVEVGDKINKGDLLTDGSVDLDELFKYAGKEKLKTILFTKLQKYTNCKANRFPENTLRLLSNKCFQERE